MKYEIVYTKDYALIVSELNSPGKEGQVFLSKENIIHTVIGWNYGDRVIVGHRPLKDAAILTGVPLLPSFSWNQQDDVEKKSRDFVKYVGGSQEQRLAFIDGYSEAKETYKYTEEDLVKAIEEARLNLTNTNSIIQSLQQPKRPKYFKCEMDTARIPYGDDGWKTIETGMKTTTNSQGQIELVGGYANE